ncbi:MAG TPA: hypothetical protein VK900_20690 [Anaerolineales bacterium]|nr:hypothetical protein [Anaerolineales bacterium]
MRFLELTIPFLLVLYLVWHHPRPFIVRLLPAAALALIPFHIALEGYRWQMIPIYALTVVLMLSSRMKIRSSSDWMPIPSLLALIPLTMAAILPVVLPVPEMPAPGGPYPVGTRIYELTDPARQEIYSGTAEARRFQIQVWYPAEVSPSDERAPWMADAEIFAPAIASYIRMPSFFLDHLALVKMPAYRESAVASTSKGYPVILFSHGWNGFSAQNTGQTIELASHGYVVVGVQHTYGAVVTVFEDGTVAYNNPSALPRGAPDTEYEAAAQKLVAQWSGDLAYALAFLEAQNNDPDSPFHNSLGISQVGVYGHSTGGGAAIQFCGTDSRCKALLGMDPFMRPVSHEVQRSGVRQPSFFMFSQVWADDLDSLNNELFQGFLQNASNSLGVISIEGTTHYDFSDLPRLSPLAPRLGLKGPIDGSLVTTILNDYLIAFFDWTLQEIPTSLFEEQNQKYNEVRFLD